MSSTLGTPPFAPCTPPFAPCTPPFKPRAPSFVLTKTTPSEAAVFHLLDMTKTADCNEALASAMAAVESLRAIISMEINESMDDIKHIRDNLESVSVQMDVLREIIDKIAVEQQDSIDDLYANIKMLKSQQAAHKTYSNALQSMVAVFMGMFIVIYANYFYSE